jgi:alpha-galactosidase
MRKKIVLIGAGSAMFTHGLVLDLMKNSGGIKWHIALVDIDNEALDSISKLVKKLILAKNFDLELTYSTDRCDVLSGADYVVTTIGVGGRRAWEQDVFIPRKYGVYQPVGDTAMPGGISRAMRMIPAMLDIITDVSRLCPDAYFFNYANPMAIICRAIKKSTTFPVVGLCHGVNNMEGYLAQFAGVDRNKLTSLSVGINHLTFMYDIRYQGKDIKPMLKEKYKNVTQSINNEPFSWEIFENYNAFPAPGDRHIVEFFTERFTQGKYYDKTLGVDAYSFEDTIKFGDDIYEEITKIAHSNDPLPEKYLDRTVGEHELLMDIIHSIENDERKVFSVNVPNNGSIPNLPKDAVLELPAAATAKGFAPLYLNDFPDVLAGIIAKYLAIIEVTVDAALKGDRNLFSEAILMGGYISDKSAVIKMVDEMIKAQSQYLPQFK